MWRPIMTEIATLTAQELSDGYACRRFSPVEVTRALLARTRMLNGRLNALYVVDDEGALAQAAAATERWARGRPLGPLDGVPTTIKDALPSIGQPSFRGSAAHRADSQAFDTDAPAVARMREAGMVFLGKTTMPDFGILASGYSSKHGVTRNPWNPSRTTGGSSAGAAAAVAAGLNPVAVGTDIVGSIRLPASFCGIVGFKPSQGRVPYHPPNSPSLVAGPMARTVHDAALLMNVIALPDARDFTAIPYEMIDYREAVARVPPPCTVGVLAGIGFGLLPDPEVVAALGKAARGLASLGHRLRPLDIAFSPDDLRTAERFYKARCRTEFSAMPAERRADAAVIDRWSAEADEMGATDLYRAFNRLQGMRERAARLIDGCDFLLLPTVTRTAFAAELPGYDASAVFEPWANTFLFNLTEQPACSMPCALSNEGLPIGVQIVGRRFDDRGVLGMARALETLTGAEDGAARFVDLASSVGE